MRSILITLILFLGCQSKKVQSPLDTIDLNLEKKSKILINEKERLSYGPFVDGLEEESTQKKEIVKGIRFHSSLYKSIYYLNFLYELEKKKINFQVVESYGFASIIAALYAKEDSISSVEWKLYRLLRSLKDKEVFSSNWRSQIETFLEREFGDTKNTQLKRLFLIPKNFNGKIQYDLNVKVKDMIVDSLFKMNKENFFLKPKVQLSSMKKIFFVDKVFSIAANSYKLNFKSLGSDNLGKYTKLSGVIFQNLESIFHYKIDKEIDIMPESLVKDKELVLSAKNLVQEIEYRLKSK